MHKRLLAAPAHHEGEQHISGKLDFGKIFWKAGLWKGAPGGRNPLSLDKSQHGEKLTHETTNTHLFPLIIFPP